MTALAEACDAFGEVTAAEHPADWHKAPAWVTDAAAIAVAVRGKRVSCYCLAGKWKGSVLCCLLQVAHVGAGCVLCGWAWVVMMKRR